MGQDDFLFYVIAICGVLNVSSISIDIVSPEMLPHCFKDSLVLGGGGTTHHSESFPSGKAVEKRRKEGRRECLEMIASNVRTVGLNLKTFSYYSIWATTSHTLVCSSGKHIQ